MLANLARKPGAQTPRRRSLPPWIPAYSGMTGIFVWAVLIMPLLASAAQAACTGVVAGGPLRLAAAGSEEAVSITFLGHASFLIESPGGVRIVTDYNDAIRAPVTPDIVTMNNAHPTHYSESVEPGVKYVLRGWDPAGGVATHRLEYRDVRIHNVPTNVREFGGTRYNGNSIFVFDIADLCIAHLGHLHHTLTPAHLAELGAIDVVMVPVDGGLDLEPARHDRGPAADQAEDRHPDAYFHRRPPSTNF